MTSSINISNITDVQLADWEATATGIAIKAGQMIRDTCGKVNDVKTKASNVDLVTETDKNVEKLVFDYLKGKYPDHKFVGEECISASVSGKCDLTDEPTWIVDPVDGTTNFVHTLPFVAVCIGLALEKKPILGIVYFPLMEKLYTARRGNGAFCNGLPIHVRPSKSLSESLICMEVGSDRSPERMNCVFKNLESVVDKCHGVRGLGSAAANICAVASGQMQAFYEFGLHCWDMCAPGAVLLEAGGCLRDTTGAPFELIKRRVIAASNEQVAEELAKALPVQLDIPTD